MATIVRQKDTGERFVLLGAGLGAYAGGRVEWLYGALEGEDASTVISVVAVSNPQGDIRWIPSDELTVVSVDGRSPAEHIDDDPPTVSG